MRIGFLIDSFAIGGTELNAIKVAESLSRHSTTLTVFHIHENGPLRARYETLGVELLHIPLTGLVSQSARRAIARIQTDSRNRQLQLLHSHCIYTNILGIGVRRLALNGTPILASRRWTGDVPRRGLATLNRIAQSTADAVLVNSPSLVDVVRNESPWSKPVYVPNMIPEGNFRIISTAERSEKRKAVGLPPDAPIVGYVARIAPVKNHRMLLDAWRSVIARVPDARLAIIGDGGTRADLEALANEYGVSNSVHFTGGISPENMPHSLLDISVLTSLDEGFPNSLLEAMAQQVPVLSTNVGGVGDLVSHQRNGLLVNVNDVDSFASSLTGMLNGS
ncbi:MAG: glycosyltransferase, partial [Gemmatimonadaceae bacterium]